MARGRQRVGARGHGRTMEEWVALIEPSGIDPLDQNAFQRCLKDAHGVRIADDAAIRAGRVRPTPPGVAADGVWAERCLTPVLGATAGPSPLP